MEKTIFIKEYTDAIKSQKAAIFAGAGLSVSAGFVDWANSFKGIAEELNLNSKKEINELPVLAQFYFNVRKSRNKLTNLIQNCFCDIPSPDENHTLLAHLPIHTYWTTNYDHLIEDSLRQAKKRCDVKSFDSDLSTSKHGSDAIVYKMHGDVDHPDKTVLLLNEYEAYHITHPSMLNALNCDLLNKTFLFVGFSFKDANLRQVLGRLRATRTTTTGELPIHFCIMKTMEIIPGESKADFEYQKRRERLFLDDLNRFGVETVMIDSFSEITEIFRAINKAYYQKTIYLSGAAHEYGKWSKENAETFIYNLSGKLVKHGFRIVTGYGVGVGNQVISGVLNEVYMNMGKQLENELIIRPFPQGGPSVKSNWFKYREDTISYSGISLFMFGNKIDKDTGKVSLSDGMDMEFDISKRHGNILIPIAATEYKARKLWKKVMDEYGGEEPYASNKNLFNTIAELEAYQNPDKLIENIINLIEKITQ